ncbi:MAG: hypothetical protein P8179_08845 [Candidatus Thiodiazotropha sp.]
MTLPKKGLRKIELEGKQYGWLIRRKPTYRQAILESTMTIAIQEINCLTPKVLHVELNVSRPDNWISKHQTQITSATIKNIITEARKSGWVYDKGGSAFEYSYGVIRDS